MWLGSKAFRPVMERREKRPERLEPLWSQRGFITTTSGTVGDEALRLVFSRLVQTPFTNAGTRRRLNSKQRYLLSIFMAERVGFEPDKTL